MAAELASQSLVRFKALNSCTPNAPNYAPDWLYGKHKISIQSSEFVLILQRVCGGRVLNDAVCVRGPGACGGRVLNNVVCVQGPGVCEQSLVVHRMLIRDSMRVLGAALNYAIGIRRKSTEFRQLLLWYAAMLAAMFG